MITEDYVSFETAKLLKEKGFKGQGEHFYEDNKITNYINYWFRITPEQRYEAIEAPTLQMAMKWLREVHNLTVECLPYMPWNAFETSFAAIHGGPVYKGVIFKDVFMLHTEEPIWAETYEEAVDATIKYCLTNLI